MSRKYQCGKCSHRFTATDPWHPDCIQCQDPNTYEVMVCDTCQKDYLFGPEGVVTNPGYFKGPFHEILLDGVLYNIQLLNWHTCHDCCRSLVIQGLGYPIPPKVCNHCHKQCIDLNGWDGAEVEKDSVCHGGYGSTTFDMDSLKFQLSPGWYCYICLDAEVKAGRTSVA